jgi:hypothetical protein
MIWSTLPSNLDNGNGSVKRKLLTHFQGTSAVALPNQPTIYPGFTKNMIPQLQHYWECDSHNFCLRGSTEKNMPCAFRIFSTICGLHPLYASSPLPLWELWQPKNVSSAETAQEPNHQLKFLGGGNPSLYYLQGWSSLAWGFRVTCGCLMLKKAQILKLFFPKDQRETGLQRYNFPPQVCVQANCH